MKHSTHTGAFLHILLGSNLVTASQLGQRGIQDGQNSLTNLILDLNEPLHKFKDLLSWFSKYMDLDETSVQVQGPTVDFSLVIVCLLFLTGCLGQTGLTGLCDRSDQ